MSERCSECGKFKPGNRSALKRKAAALHKQLAAEVEASRPLIERQERHRRTSARFHLTGERVI